MLQRHQVLLTDWLADHIKKIADRYDLSFSETMRAALCIFYMDIIVKDYPGSDCKVKDIKRKITLKEGNYDKTTMEEFHKSLSRVYFEARKAIEFFWAEEKKRLRKK